MIATTALAGGLSCKRARDLLLRLKQYPEAVYAHVNHCSGCKAFYDDLQRKGEADPQDLAKYPVSVSKP